MLDVKYVTFSGMGSWTFVTGFCLRLYKSNRNQLSGLPSLPLPIPVMTLSYRLFECKKIKKYWKKPQI